MEATLPDPEKVYSNKLWKAVVDYLDHRFGRGTTDRILEDIGIDRLAISDPNGYQTLEFGERLIAAAHARTGAGDIPYQAGRALPDSMTKVGGFIVGLTSPSLCMKLLGQAEKKMALKTITHSEPIGPNRYRIRISFRDGFRESLIACQNRIGAYESIPRFFGLPFAQVDHPSCAFRGDAQCEYLVRFPRYSFLAFKRAAMAFGLVFLVCTGMAMGSQSQGWLWAGVSALIGAMASFAYYKHRQAASAEEWTLLANEGLSRQNRELVRNNAQINSLQAMTLQLGHLLRVEEICGAIVETLVRDFGYGSSQIWLLDEEKRFLVNRAAHGYAPDLTQFIRNTRFEMGRNWDNPYGLLVQTLEQGKTLLVNDVAESLSRLSDRTRDFIQALGPSSFIITPLFEGQAAIGLLTAEHHSGAKVSNEDRLLFQSISNIIANALVKAELYEGMERKIELRTRELEETGRQLLSAREMAIQSEKLSSLGRMAAGVAHEINNPLNFLVNIMPDVRRDLETLERIRDLARRAAGDGAAPDAGSPLGPEELRRGLEEIESQYPLADHLAEKDYVFDRIKKALDKSTRIANSLKVFSRSSSKESVERVPLAALIGDLLSMLPQKNRGDTRIGVDIPPDLSWPANRIEMEQACLAVVTNAIDAMEQKGLLEIRGRALPGGGVELTFRDQGPGITAEALKSIFDPFYTTKPPGKGTGLGLTIANEIVRKYGGRIAVESEVGKGTVFTFRFDSGAVPAAGKDVKAGATRA